MYITPGSIATPERRIKEIFQPSILLDQAKNPCDRFGEGEYGHVVQFHGDSAAVTAVISFSTKILHIDILKAIDLAGDNRRWQDYLGGCARGHLTADDLDKVIVVDKTNYGDSSAQQINQMTHKKARLMVVLADWNILVQCAVVSYMDPSHAVCFVQLGSCVHCAVSNALMCHTTGLLD